MQPKIRFHLMSECSSEMLLFVCYVLQRDIKEVEFQFMVIRKRKKCVISSHTKERILFNIVKLYKDLRRILCQLLLSVGSFKDRFKNISWSRQSKHSNKYTSSFTHVESAEILYIRLSRVPVGVLCNIWNLSVVVWWMFQTHLFPLPWRNQKRFLDVIM